jgi:hypothetical protein
MKAALAHGVRDDDSSNTLPHETLKGTALLRAADGPRVKQRALFESQATIDFDRARIVIADGEEWALTA